MPNNSRSIGEVARDWLGATTDVLNRGMVAGVLGAPVDIATMAMRPFGYNAEAPVGSSEWIGKQMQRAGMVSGVRRPIAEFAASLIDPATIHAAVAKGVAAAGGALGGLYAMHKMAGTVDQTSSLARMGEATRQSGVIKGKGGNWLTGSVEDALKELKKSGQTGRVGQTIEPQNLATRLAKLDADIAAWSGKGIDPASGVDLSEVATHLTRERNMLRPSASLNSWIEGPLTKYVKTRMASPEDEVRKLAEQGVLHFEPRGIRDRAPIMDNVFARRAMSQMPTEDVARTPLGVQWERYADAAVSPREVSELGAGVWGKNPWLENLGKDDTVYTVDYHMLGGPMAQENLGFPHLIDELSNALNPASGLPRHLQLTPEAMKNLSVEKAVRRVADINKWRASQMAEANKAIAFDEKTAPVFKEYQTVPGHGNGQPNEKGLHWREIKKGGASPQLLERYANDPRIKKSLGDVPEERVPRLALEDQLKYEGDTMGHCVGGYCEDVASGKSKIYSLRDAKGRPHVTIEVEPGRLSGKTSLADWAASYERTHGAGSSPAFLAEHPEIAQAFEPTVKQIKGKGNKAPKDEYVPFVQDFIRSQKFSDIGDLANAQMYRASNTFNKAELAYLEGHGAKLSGEEYLTKAEVDALQSLFKSK